MTNEDTELSYEDCMQEAIEALKEALSQLDLGWYRCSCCGSIRYTNFPDKRRGDAISAAITKIESAVDRKE